MDKKIISKSSYTFLLGSINVKCHFNPFQTVLPLSFFIVTFDGKKKHSSTIQIRYTTQMIYIVLVVITALER